MRCTAFDWLRHLTSHLKLNEKILFSSIYILDKFITLFTNIKKEELQLISVTCFNISVKFNNITSYSIESIRSLLKNQYSDKEIKYSEAFIFSVVGEVNIYNPYDLVMMTVLKFVDELNCNGLDIKKDEVTERIMMMIEYIAGIEAWYYFSVYEIVLAVVAVYCLVYELNCKIVTDLISGEYPIRNLVKLIIFSFKKNVLIKIKQRNDILLSSINKGLAKKYFKRKPILSFINRCLKCYICY